MKNFMLCRRTFIATLSIICLTAIGIVNHMDVSMALASVAIGLAAANAHERASKSKSEVRYGAGPAP
jgi:hypothetical protein